MNEANIEAAVSVVNKHAGNDKDDRDRVTYLAAQIFKLTTEEMAEMNKRLNPVHVTLTYEKPALMVDIAEAAAKHLEPGESVIRRAPFRWHLCDSSGAHAIPNAYEGQSAERVCEDRGWELVHDFGHVAIVRPQTV